MTVPNQQIAMFGILIIILVIVVLVGFTASYSSAVNRLVVQPLEKMMGTLRSSAMLMINSLKELEAANPAEEAKEKEAASAKQARKDGELSALLLWLVVFTGGLEK
jgi:type IV secretory pathway VirB6-like protein